jgi:basic amino acid/polyamine antiporter, APA family
MSFIRSIGRWAMVGLVINSIVGYGIFGLPSIVAGLLGTWSLFAYVIAAFVAGVVIACYAEVASRFAEPGGSYLYNYVAFGPVIAIVCGWLSLLTRSTGAAAAIAIFVSYTAGLWPVAAHPPARLALMSALVGVLTIANIVGVRAGAGLSTIFAVAKLVPLFLLIGIGLLLHSASTNAMPLLTLGFGKWMDALLYLSSIYGGFDAAVMSQGEVRDPGRDVPFGLLVGLAVVTVVYLGVQAVVLFTIGTTSSDRPLAAAGGVLLGQGGAVIVSIAALLSTYGSLACQFVNVPRLIFAMGEHGDFPRFVTHTSRRHHTPETAILVFASVVWVMAVLGGFKWAVLVGSAARIPVYATVCLALIPLRRIRPQAGFEVPWPRTFAILGAIFTAALLPRLDVWGSLLLVFVSVAAVFFWKYWRRTTVSV